jgi:hypothetical protein
VTTPSEIGVEKDLLIENYGVETSSATIRELNEEFLDITQPTRMKYKNKKGQPLQVQDLFETPEELTNIMVQVLISRSSVDAMKQMVVWEPCAGHDAMVKTLEKHCASVIATDLYTKEEKHDFLTWEPKVKYDVICSNTPFKNKFLYFERAIELKKPFALIFPSYTMSSPTFFKRKGSVPIIFQLICGRCPFLHNGKWVTPCDIVIMYGYLGNTQDELILTPFKFEAEDDEPVDEEDEEEDDEDYEEEN